MRVLHTSDLHLGRQFNGIGLEEDHQRILDQVVDALISRKVDVLVIAGDVYDRATPPATAVRQFNEFLSRVASETAAAVVMIAGNHDSGDRIASMSIMTDTRRALIRGEIRADEPPLVLADQHGKVAFSALPFCYEYAARACFSDETLSSPEDVLAAQVAAARRNVPEGARWVIVAHTFVSGGLGSESERPLARVGGIDTVRPEIFQGAHYVALGHLHRPQSVGGGHIRYCGSPLAFGFHEADTKRSMTLVEIGAAGEIVIDELALDPLRAVRILKGKHAELLRAEPSTDFLKIILTDDHPVIDGMKRLREVFPNACDLVYQQDERVQEARPEGALTTKAADPLDVLGDFLEHVRNERATEAELSIVGPALQTLRQMEDSQ